MNASTLIRSVRQVGSDRFRERRGRIDRDHLDTVPPHLRMGSEPHGDTLVVAAVDHTEDPAGL
nr:hypothetical protein JVH1_9125 [Rhodococcus sp. JVH1]